MMVGISLHRNASSKEYNVNAHVAKAAWAYSYLRKRLHFLGCLGERIRRLTPFLCAFAKMID